MTSLAETHFTKSYGAGNMANKETQKTVLVTGGSGFVGGMVCRLLVDAGHNVINVDKRKKEIEGVTQYPFDIDNHQLKGVIQLTKPDTIMHFAAEHEVGRSVADPATYYWNNVANTIALLNQAVKAGVKNFIFSSSSSVYGMVDVFPTPEATDRDPVSPYGKTKKMVEDILVDYHTAYGLNFAALRYFNAAGAAPNLTHGYTQDPATHLIPIIARAAIEGTQVNVFGDSYPTKDGTAERDYTHVFDIATAHLSAMNYLEDGGHSGAFNIGAGNSVSVLDVIDTFNRVNNTNVKYGIVDKRPGDSSKTFADISKASNAFGWSPVYKLEDIVKHAYEWEKKVHKVK
jgi:UDP-glucose 4-epimerase